MDCLSVELDGMEEEFRRGGCGWEDGREVDSEELLLLVGVDNDEDWREGDWMGFIGPGKGGVNGRDE